MKSMLVSIAVALMFCASPVSSAEFPKTGEAEYDTYYVGNFVAKIDSGVGTSSIVDETGINRNVKGEGPFHDMSVRCLYHMSSVGAVGPHLFENAVGPRVAPSSPFVRRTLRESVGEAHSSTHGRLCVSARHPCRCRTQRRRRPARSAACRPTRLIPIPPVD